MSASTQSRKTWYTLREFETREITSRRYSALHEKELNEAKAKAIISNFIQAREYFQNASAADFTVRPLLQYYGVSSLSRGLALFLKETDENTLEPYHGLTTCDWNKILKGNCTNFGQLAIKLTDGVFHELLVSTNRKCYLRAHSSGVDWAIAAKASTFGSMIRFEEIVARIPDISNQYAAWTGNPSPSFVIVNAFHRHPDNQNRNVWKLTVGKSDDAALNLIFPPEKCPSLEKKSSGTNVVVEYDGSFMPFISQWINEDVFGIGNVVLYSYPDSGEDFTPLAACFMLSYILGMLCRYHPVIWTGLIRLEKGDALYPLVVRILDWVQDMFPAMVVDILQGPYAFEKRAEQKNA